MASEVKTRLLEFLHFKRISQKEFCEKIGVSPAYIGAMRKSFSDEKIKRVREFFPELNTSWLLYGEGGMLNPGQEEGGEASSLYEVPLLPVEACAGNLQEWSDGYMLRQCEKVVCSVKGVDFAIRVSGDSMEPELRDGTFLFIKRINERAFIPWGNNMVLDTENGVLVKCVYPAKPLANGEKCIEARSINPRYPPIDIPASSIFGIYRIMGSMLVNSTM